MARQPVVSVTGAKEVRKALGKGGKEVKDALKAANRDVAEMVIDDAKHRAASRGTPMQQEMKKGLKAAANNRQAIAEIRNLGSSPFAVAAFMGAKRRTGWYAAGRYKGGPPQFPEWVGNQHQAGARTIGLDVYPYHLGPAISQNIEEIADEYEKAVFKRLRALGLVD